MKDNVEENKHLTEPMLIHDWKALFHFLIGLESTFGGVSLQMLSKMAQKQGFKLFTDLYHEDLIKGQEIAPRKIEDQLIFDGWLGYQNTKRF